MFLQEVSSKKIHDKIRNFKVLTLYIRFCVYADFSFLLNTRGAVDNKAYKEILAGLGIRLKCVCVKK